MYKKTKKRTSVGRKIIGFILIVAACLLTLDVVLVMIPKINAVVLKGDYLRIFHEEMICCGILILFALDVRFGFLTKIRFKAAKVIGWILRIAVIAATLIILFFCGKVIVGSNINTAAPAKNAIVLGLALQNGQPVKDLIFRLETAKDYLQENRDATLILTGGNPDESGRTEAEVMQDLLMEMGVSEESLYLEDQAATTIENFANTVRMIDPTDPVVLISSNYHMDRSVKTAKKAGFTNVLRLPARSEILKYGSNMMWEVALDINAYIR